MRRRGLVLIAVLWIVTVLGVTVGGLSRWLRTEERAATNRRSLVRGRWAAEACIAIAKARWADGAPTALPVSLGRGVYCTWHLDDPGLRLNVNRAAPGVLAGMLTQCGASPDSAVAWAARVRERRAERRFETVAEVQDVAPLCACALAMLTVEGRGQVSASAASQVLLALPGLSVEAVRLLEGRRAQGNPVASLDELAQLLSPTARAALLDHYAELSGVLGFQPDQLVLRAEGWVGAESDLHATIEEVVVPQREALATIARRVW
jgi:type II secretory pathway component PulK